MLVASTPVHYRSRQTIIPLRKRIAGLAHISIMCTDKVYGRQSQAVFSRTDGDIADHQKQNPNELYHCLLLNHVPGKSSLRKRKKSKIDATRKARNVQLSSPSSERQLLGERYALHPRRRGSCGRRLTWALGPSASSRWPTVSRNDRSRWPRRTLSAHVRDNARSSSRMVGECWGCQRLTPPCERFIDPCRVSGTKELSE